ncbi:cytochrome c biogenesis CcdA family protein [Desulfatiglans anilini]|uniref:cytochrome c biogenesis CcdA family protein n=1 Tax=Desulfatiglans anilini TaxID=90728 RepID=UPI00041C889F|nr:cytochrome c biogenesis protein CcdA [Desulfatiglans anilini]
MFEEIFLTINQWMSGGVLIGGLGCFLWGMVSVLFSPCHLASIPLIIAYVGGQRRVLQPRDGVYFSGSFSVGLFTSIALVGVLCAWLGRMLGDIGNYWQILVGLVLVWVALGMLGVERCTFSGRWLQRLNFSGLGGAFGLGLAYGVLSGSCTFGFIAPILAIITVQEAISTGVFFIFLFALGHCLPILVAGSSTAAARRLIESSVRQGAGIWFRRGAGVLIGCLGVYFIGSPFIVL